MSILQRYLWREMAGSFLAVTGVLLAILLVYQGGAVLARAAELQYPSAVVLRLFALGAVQNISLLLPFGLLLAVVLAVGRLYSDNELFAAQACGLSLRRVQQAILLVAAPVVLLAGTLTLQLAPRAAVAEAELRAEALRSALSVPIQPGQFRSLGGGRTVVYARGVARGGELLDVFVKRGLGDLVQATVARRARMIMAPDGLSQTILLQDGEQLEGTPGNANWRIVRFALQSIPLVLPAAKPEDVRRSELATARLFGSANPEEHTELQLRLGWPLMTLVVSLLALPLGRLRPRQGRFARVWLAVLLFALYANLLQAAAVWLEHGDTPAALGLWWVHALVAVLAWALVTLQRRLGRS